MREKCAQGKREFSLRSFSLLLSIFLLLFAGLAGTNAFAQATISTGSIQGVVTDPSGAVVPKAKVTLTNKATGLIVQAPATSAGLYNSGPLLPGEYGIRVEAPGFKTFATTLAVEVGTTTPGNFTLQVGEAATTVEVTGAAVTVNTEQATIQGVVTQQQIQNLPLNGRNYLDLAGLEPGVQIQDGSHFDPTKEGFSSVSFGGRNGRAARIDVDGIDISDETVGTVVSNIPLNSIQEFQTEQSTLDPSTEITSAGAVNVVTRSGTNGYHGDFFFEGRSNQLAARIAPKPLDWSRKHAGADFGGPFIKDKLFFFGSWERIQQDQAVPITLVPPFTALNGSFNGFFRDSMYFGRMDWKPKPGWSVFYRFSFELARNGLPFLANIQFSPFESDNKANVHVAGLDFATGHFTHSMRFGDSKYTNGIADAVTAAGAFNPLPQIAFAIGNVSTFCQGAGDVVCFGINTLVPQGTLQRNVQGKYDGSWLLGSHIIRYGFSMNAIKAGGFAAFGAFATPTRSAFTTSNDLKAAAGPFPGGDTNPLNWPVNRVFATNGQGFFSERPAFDQPAGGNFDTRVEWYVGDSWKARPSLTITAALRYVRDTGRSDSDLPDQPLLDEFGASVGAPGLGRPVRQPNKNYGGMFGITWAPFASRKTVFRAGVGEYYENTIYNSVIFDRPGRLPAGLFFGFESVCPSGVLTLPDGTSVTSINGKNIATQVCGQPVGTVANDIAAIQTLFQQATKQAGPQSNGEFFPNALCASAECSGVGLYDPNFQTPRSFMLNAGIQQQLWHNTVLSIDYVRNVGTHYLVAVDVNHNGDAGFLNTAGALAAISKTNKKFGCGTGTDSASINCAIAAGATIASYANRGLGDSVSITGGTPCALVIGAPCAFGGINPDFGPVQINEPIGRSLLNAMQVKLRGQQAHIPGMPSFLMKDMSYQIAYQLGEFDSLFNDQDFNANSATDNRNPLRFFGPSALDRTDQFSVGAFFKMLGTRVGMFTHWGSNLPQTLTLPCNVAASDLFQNDVTGDGTGCDVLPGTNVGAFGRSVRVGDLNSAITSFSNTGGNQFTPAGNALLGAGLFTSAQLTALCATTPSLTGNTTVLPNHAGATCNDLFPLQLSLAPPGQVGNPSEFTFDLSLGWDLHLAKLSPRVPENWVISPSVAIYNLFNRQNFGTLQGSLDGFAGEVNGTTPNLRTNLVNLGSGAFAAGAPRQVVFGAKISF